MTPNFPIRPPRLDSLSEVDLFFLPSSEQVPLRACVSARWLSILNEWQPGVQDSDETLLNYLEESYQFSSAAEAAAMFKKIHLTLSQDHPNDRFTHYLGKFYDLKARCKSLKLPDQWYLQKFVEGLRPNFVRRRMQEEIQSEEATLAKISSEALELYLQYDQFSHSTKKQYFQRRTERPSFRTESSKEQMKKHDQRREDINKRNCWYCHQPGHIALHCPKKKIKDEPREAQSRPLFSHGLFGNNEPMYSNCLVTEPSSLLQTTVTINNFDLPCILDSGAQTSTISHDLAQRLSLPIIPTQQSLKTADGNDANVIGEIRCKLSILVKGAAGRLIIDTSLIVLSGIERVLIGADILTRLGLMTENGIHIELENFQEDDDTEIPDPLSVCTVQDSVSFHREIEIKKLNPQLIENSHKLLEKYSEVFNPEFPAEGMKVTPMTIPFKDESKKVWFEPRPLKPSRLQEAMKQFEDFIKKGIARVSSRKHQSPIVYVEYKNKKPRICGDYSGAQGINANSILVPANLPLMTEIDSMLVDAQYIAEFDLPRAYYQMPIAENDIPKTAVAIPGMAIEFCRASFGLTNIPAIFQNIMDGIYRDHQTFVFIDNIVLAAKSEENFLAGIEKILKLCIKYNIRLAPKKSRLVHFSVPIHLFGFIYQNHQKFLDPDRVKSILQLPAPANTKQLKSFLGSVNFMKDFIPDIASMTAPLYKLLRKGVPYRFDENCSIAFNELKSSLARAPPLSLPDSTKNIVIVTDASNNAVGGVILQEDHPQSNEWEHKKFVPLSFFSKILSPSQRNWSTIQKELYALVSLLSVKATRSFLISNKFTVYLDHKN
ncbi:hypothetical protein GEMRC1_007755 [Eukaryota sp. GEM-RC1]